MKKRVVSVIALFSLMFIGVACNQSAKGTTGATGADSTLQVATSGIVYFNMDSLVSKYQMFIDLSAEFKAKAEKIDGQIASKGRALEAKMRTSQEKIEKGLVTRAEAEQLYATVQNEQQEVLAFREQKMMEVQEEQMVMQNKIFDAIKTYVAKYNAEKNYTMILNTSSATNTVMAADPTLDITKELLTGLNAEYVPEKKQDKKETKEVKK